MLCVGVVGVCVLCLCVCVCACVCVCVCVAVPPVEPEPAPEPPHRRSSSMKVTGTTYRSSVRGRTSDDMVIGTHLGMGNTHTHTHTHTHNTHTHTHTQTHLHEDIILCIYSHPLTFRVKGNSPTCQKNLHPATVETASST